MVLRVFYSKASIKTLRRMPKPTAHLIRGKIETYASDPSHLTNNVKRLKGASDLYRLRVGDWRVVFVQTAERIDVEAVGPRGGIYE